MAASPRSAREEDRARDGAPTHSEIGDGLSRRPDRRRKFRAPNGRPPADAPRDQPTTLDAPPQPDESPATSGLLERPTELQGDRRGYVLRRWLLVADVAGLCGALLIVQLFGGLVPGSGHYLLFDFVAFVIAVPAWLLLLRAYGLYHVDSRRADHALSEEITPMLQMTALSCWGLLLVCSATGIAQVAISRLALLWVSVFALLLGFRAITRGRARRQDWYRQSTLVVGTPSQSSALMAKIKRHPEYGLDVVACLELPDAAVGTGVDGRGGAAAAAPDRLTGGEAAVLRTVGELRVDRVVLAASVGGLCEHSTLLSEL